MSDLRTAAQQALDDLIENARLLGVTQAKKGFGCYSQEDANLERAWHQGIAKHSATIRAALAQQAEAAQEPITRLFGTLPVHDTQQAEPVEPGAWVASKDGRVIYDDASTDDGLLRVSGDFENDEQRVRYAQRIVDKLNAAPPQRKPLMEEVATLTAQRDDIIRMAREADREWDCDRSMEEWVECFAALVAAAEREACAKLAESTVCDTHLPTGVRIYGTRAAAAIRARTP